MLVKGTKEFFSEKHFFLPVYHWSAAYSHLRCTPAWQAGYIERGRRVPPSVFGGHYAEWSLQEKSGCRLLEEFARLPYIPISIERLTGVCITTPCRMLYSLVYAALIKIM